MKKARATIKALKEFTIVDAAGYVRLRDEFSKAAISLTCVECGEPVFLNDEKGAKGFQLVNLEIARRGQKQKKPGFSHYAHSANAACPLYFPNDPRFATFHEKNAFDALEKERNIATLDRRNMRDAIAEAQKFFLHRLTGSPEISTSDKDALTKIEKRLQTLIGLANHPWILAYLGPILLGSRTRLLGNRECRLEYKGVGEQKLLIKSLDGFDRALILPQEIQLCFSRKGGEAPQPLISHGKPISFPVSHAFAYKVVKHQWTPPTQDHPAPQAPYVPQKQLSKQEAEAQKAGQNCLDLR